MTLQKSFGLPVLSEYSNGYRTLIIKLIRLQTASVPKKDIQTQLKRERKLLELLKADSHSPVTTWFEDICSDNWGPGHLLISGYNLGHSSGVQTGLDFAARENELFNSEEMGDDILHALDLCIQSQENIISRLTLETQVLADTIKWCRKLCG